MSLSSNGGADASKSYSATAAPSSLHPIADPAYTRVGVRGVRLKKFEEAVADLLPHVSPTYVCLPRRPSQDPDWPLRGLPPHLRVRGDGRGQLSGSRATGKEGQLRSMLQCVGAMLPPDGIQERPIRIVEFCGGTGHLALPMAALFPHCEVVVVDLKAASLKLLHEKALLCNSTSKHTNSVSFLNNPYYQRGSNLTQHEQIKRQCAGMPNLSTFHGSIETFREDFDVGLALHACGEASDVVLQTCAAVRANFCVSPCCVGKLHRQRHNPYVYHATADNVPSIEYPQSSIFSSLLDQDHWDELCKAADYGDVQELRTPRNATRRTAKALLETDRLLCMEESHGYNTALTRMDPWECSPKNDILLGWHPQSTRVHSPFQSYSRKDDDESNADIERSRLHLLATNDEIGIESGDQVDWTRQEEEEIRELLEKFVQGEDRIYALPLGLGRRKRKLVHAIAEQMGLDHWCQGRRSAEKTVVVRKRGTL